METTVRRHGVPLARGSSALVALLGTVMVLAPAREAPAARQKPDIFGIWIGIDPNSPNFGRWKLRALEEPAQYTQP